MRITGVATNDYKYEQCQMPINIDEELRFLVTFDEIGDLTNNSNNRSCKHSKFCGTASKNTEPSNNNSSGSYKNRNNRCSDDRTGHTGSIGKPSCCDSCYKTIKNQDTKSVPVSTNKNHKKRGSDKIDENSGYPRKQFKDDVKAYFKKNDFLDVAKVKKTDLANLMKRLVPCIGCRKSVESMFDLMLKKRADSKMDISVFKNVAFNSSDELILTETLLETDFDKLYDHLFIYGPRCAKLVEGIRTKKSNNRCWLHSLDSRGALEFKQKNFSNKMNKNNEKTDDVMIDGSTTYLDNGSMVKSNVGSLGYFGMGSMVSRDCLKETWWNIWKMLPDHCKAELCCLEAKTFLGVVESYLERHGFCVDCKCHVLKAYAKLCSDKVKPTSAHSSPNNDEHLNQSSIETDSEEDGLYEVSCSDSDVESKAEHELEDWFIRKQKIRENISIMASKRRLDALHGVKSELKYQGGPKIDENCNASYELPPDHPLRKRIVNQFNAPN